MLSRIRQAFGMKSDVEKEAAAIWANGDMLVDWRTPRLGLAWSEKYYPYWRQWAGEKDSKREILYDRNYASIEDDQFWKRAMTLFEAPYQFQCAAGDAARRGNLVMLKALPEEYIQGFADLYRLPQRQAGRELVHPGVVAFMREKGYWGQPEIDAMASDYQFLNKHVSDIKAFDGGRRGLCAKEFVTDWCVQVFRDYNWSADAQAQFLGNMLMTFDGGVWLDNKDVFAPLLHPALDVALLAGVCGFDPRAYGDPQPNGAMEQLYTTVQQVSQYGRLNVWMQGVPASQDPLSIEGGHLGLNLLVDLVAPSTPIDLYRVALDIKRRELGLDATESFALPALS